MWVPLLIVVLAACMVIGPIMLMQPTESQRRLIKRRETAQKLGLRVHLVPVPEGIKNDEGSRQLAMYCLPWKTPERARIQWTLVRRQFSHGMHFCGVWDWDGEAAPVTDQQALSEADFAALPETVVAVAAGPQGLCCYWRERGSPQVVAAIAAWLESHAAAME